ncbi:MAG: LysM peptidoglycan-binding domain-containing protein [Pirellulaceae bacterium]|nr:LysM peptidoglycan-binding domain-containing protein [Pirellulaceae bacterium]
MQTIKSFIVVALLIAVCYGAFVALHAPEVSIPEELQQWANATGPDTIEDFQIPTIELPDSFAQQSALALSHSPTNHGFAAAESSGLSSSGEAITNDTALPRFPEVNLPKLTATPTDSQPKFPDDSQWGLVADTPLAEYTPENASVGPASNDALSGQDTTATSGAKLASTTPGVSIGFDSFPAGPSIEFNADSTAGRTAASNLSATGLAVDDLISALDDLPALDGSNPSNELAASAGTSDLAESEQPGLLEASVARTASATSIPVQMASASPSGSTPISTPVVDQSASLGSAASSANAATLTFTQARSQALALAQQGKLSDALEMMSQYYESPELGYTEHTDLVDLLDALSREVIYSERLLLEPAYTVAARDTLQSIADKHRVSTELLAAINRLGDSASLVPNSQIKVLEGPFRAQVSLSRGELTLFLRKMYAGRFPVSISKKNRPPQGNFEIVDRRRDRTYYGTSVVIPATAPTNPYGGYWLSLGNNLAIHGSAEQVTSDLEDAGCISLAPLDAADVYRILAKGATVEIRQ